jgi:hypothetical protein
MKLSRVAGTTSQTANVFIRSSVASGGGGLTGLVYNASGLLATYIRPKAAAVAITLATQTVTGAWSSGGLVEISSSTAPGWYRLDIPDAAMAASAEFVDVMLFGAANMAPLNIEIELTGWNNQDGVHGGLSALPNTAVTTNASLLTSGTGTAQISNSSGQVILQAGTGAGQLDFTSGIVKSNSAQWLGGTIPAVNVTGVPLIDLKYTLGTLSPAAAGSVRADSVTGAVGSVTGNVGGNVTGSVGSVVAGVSITAGQLFIKKNVQLTITFPMTDSTTHLPATGLTVTAKRSIDGAAIGSCANAVTELSLGLYSLVLAAADVNGAMISLVLSAAAADTRFIGLVTQA